MTPKPETPLPERILDAAEEVLRRYGPEKTTVVDIARALGMSHGNIYRHFPSKQALLNAVAVRWLHPINVPLEAIAHDRTRPAAERLRDWFEVLRAAKRRKVCDEPELFRVHQQVVRLTPDVVADHVRSIHDQVAGMIADGVASGEFAARTDARVAARALLQATSPLHHPALLTHGTPPTAAEAHAILDLLLSGLRAGVGRKASH